MKDNKQKIEPDLIQLPVLTKREYFADELIR